MGLVCRDPYPAVGAEPSNERRRSVCDDPHHASLLAARQYFTFAIQRRQGSALSGRQLHVHPAASAP